MKEKEWLFLEDKSVQEWAGMLAVQMAELWAQK